MKGQIPRAFICRAPTKTGKPGKWKMISQGVLTILYLNFTIFVPFFSLVKRVLNCITSDLNNFKTRHGKTKLPNELPYPHFRISFLILSY